MTELNSDWGADAEGMKMYNCPSCGAELICDSSTGATSCPYCGNPTVVPGQFTGALKPNYVIPFKVEKDAAIEALKKHYKGKIFLPGTFTSNDHLEEIKGVYVPFWMFDGKGDASATYKASNTSVHRSSNEEITTSTIIRVRRGGNMSFEKVPVDASTKMPDDYMDSIEPYDYSELKEFSTAYLPGFLADKYDVTVEECVDRADTRAKKTVSDALLHDASIGYTSCFPRNEYIQLQRGKVHYALLPVWLLNTKWNGKDYLFAMNGQSGKFVGDLPMDKKKFWSMFFGLGAGLSAISSLLILLLR
jgi:DNA-directed RNA polymerase subunit RPC12/RpoP